MSTFLRTLAFGCFLLACSMQAHSDSFGDILLPGKVIQGHAKIESDCDKCHKKFDKDAQPLLCKECHKEIGKDIGEKQGYHGRMKEGKACNECHTDHKGRDARIVIFNPVEFDHKQADFQLRGAHLNAKVQCKDCHPPKAKYREAASTCNGCHKKDDKHKGGLGQDCAKCHSEKNWKTANFDHDKTSYRLLGKHADVKCVSCHIGEKFKNTPKQCSACHKKDDKHKGKFGAKCETCHVERDWKGITFDHDKRTRYPLLGKHRPPAKCTGCHKGDLYGEKLETTCNSCHQKDDKHKGSLGSKCESCHVERDWKDTTFDHDKRTKYPLLGKHRPPTKCDSCHKGNLYRAKPPTRCYECHKEDDKHQRQLGNNCKACHTEKSWTESNYDHRQSAFPLTGKHVQVECKKCHAAPTFMDASSECLSCHEKQDTHKLRFGKQCERCHNTRDWKLWDFDHDKTGTRLEGGHKNIPCYDCHRQPLSEKASLPVDCDGCHDKDDVHNGSFGPQCERCHDASSWKKIRIGSRILQ